MKRIIIELFGEKPSSLFIKLFIYSLVLGLILWLFGLDNPKEAINIISDLFDFISRILYNSGFGLFAQLGQLVFTGAVFILDRTNL